jgi:molecular chaperone GrpE
MHNELHKHDKINPQVAADIEDAAVATTEMPAEDSEDIIELHALLAQFQQQLADANNANLRAHADFDNYRKRMRQERDQEYSRGKDRVLAELLPIIDDFERALNSAADVKSADALRQGVELIFRQLSNMLARFGITPMQVEGQRFDPKYHDAAARIPSADKPEHTIVGEIQRGYLKGGEVFRPAKVIVSVAPEESVAQ